MIKPISVVNNSFFTLMATNKALKEAGKILKIKDTSKFESIIVTSKTSTDISSINGLQNTMKAFKGKKNDLTFNPLYFPMTKLQVAELSYTYDDEGDIQKINGFENPAILAEVADKNYGLQAVVAYERVTHGDIDDFIKAEGYWS